MRGPPPPLPREDPDTAGGGLAAEARRAPAVGAEIDTTRHGAQTSVDACSTTIGALSGGSDVLALQSGSPAQPRVYSVRLAGSREQVPELGDLSMGGRGRGGGPAGTFRRIALAGLILLQLLLMPVTGALAVTVTLTITLRGTVPGGTVGVFPLELVTGGQTTTFSWTSYPGATGYLFEFTLNPSGFAVPNAPTTESPGNTLRVSPGAFAESAGVASFPRSAAGWRGRRSRRSRSSRRRSPPASPLGELRTRASFRIREACWTGSCR